MILIGTPLTTPAELEAMRLIRNASRQWMTRDLAEVTPAAQAAWWDKMRRADPEDFQAIVYRRGVATVVGYGMLTRRASGKMFVSLAVDEAHRRRGYGTKIYLDLADRVREPVYAEIRRDNAASLRAARAAGFIHFTSGGETITLVSGGRAR